MANQRSWTYLNEDAEPNEAMSVEMEALMQEWNELNNEIEAEGFRRQAAYEDGDDPGDHFETAEELQAWERSRAVADQRKQLRLSILETMMANHGGRVMRPYEHWNEDEQLMAYLERER